MPGPYCRAPAFDGFEDDVDLDALLVYGNAAQRALPRFVSPYEIETGFMPDELEYLLGQLGIVLSLVPASVVGGLASDYTVSA